MKWRPELNTRLARGKDAQETLEDRSADIVVIPRDQLDKIKEKHARRFRTFIIDELSGFKNNKSKRFKLARRITRDMPYVWGLTGTPAPQGLLDLWPQMFIIDRGECLGTTLGSYRSRYFTPGPQLPNGVITGWNLRPGAATRIHERLRPRALSMGTEGRVALPPVTENDIKVSLPPRVKAQYERLRNDLVLDAMADGVFTAQNAASLSNRLRQLASGFLYPDADEVPDRQDDDYTLFHTAKLDALEELVESAQGTPILTAYAFRAELHQLQRRFPQARLLRGDQDVRDWNAGRLPMLIVHPASAGHGLNLQQGGHTMAWYGLPWSLEEYQQTNKRLARSGQQHPVVIHHIMTQGTVDLSVRRALAGKDSVQSALLAHLDPEGIL